MPFHGGEQVVIHGLTSAKGQLLNGNKGVITTTAEGQNKDRDSVEVNGVHYALLRENLDPLSS